MRGPVRLVSDRTLSTSITTWARDNDYEIVDAGGSWLAVAHMFRDLGNVFCRLLHDRGSASASLEVTKPSSGGTADGARQMRVTPCAVDSR
jgi:hypothetical protein